MGQSCWTEGPHCLSLPSLAGTPEQMAASLHRPLSLTVLLEPCVMVGGWAALLTLEVNLDLEMKEEQKRVKLV